VLGLNKNKKKEYGNNRKKLEGVEKFLKQTNISHCLKEEHLQEANISHVTSHSNTAGKKTTIQQKKNIEPLQ
jgi:hypothetical protein